MVSVWDDVSWSFPGFRLFILVLERREKEAHKNMDSNWGLSVWTEMCVPGCFNEVREVPLYDQILSIMFILFGVILCIGWFSEVYVCVCAHTVIFINLFSSFLLFNMFKQAIPFHIRGKRIWSSEARWQGRNVSCLSKKGTGVKLLATFSSLGEVAIISPVAVWIKGLGTYFL